MADRITPDIGSLGLNLQVSHGAERIGFHLFVASYCTDCFTPGYIEVSHGAECTGFQLYTWDLEVSHVAQGLTKGGENQSHNNYWLP